MNYQDKFIRAQPVPKSPFNTTAVSLALKKRRAKRMVLADKQFDEKISLRSK